MPTRLTIDECLDSACRSRAAICVGGFSSCPFGGFLQDQAPSNSNLLQSLFQVSVHLGYLLQSTLVGTMVDTLWPRALQPSPLALRGSE